MHRNLQNIFSLLQFQAVGSLIIIKIQQVIRQDDLVIISVIARGALSNRPHKRWKRDKAIMWSLSCGPGMLSIFVFFVSNPQKFFFYETWWKKKIKIQLIIVQHINIIYLLRVLKYVQFFSSTYSFHCTPIFIFIFLFTLSFLLELYPYFYPLWLCWFSFFFVLLFPLLYIIFSQRWLFMKQKERK